MRHAEISFLSYEDNLNNAEKQLLAVNYMNSVMIFKMLLTTIGNLAILPNNQMLIVIKEY